MRTAVWSLAALAGAALALPSGNDGWSNDGWGDDGWGTTSSVKSKASPMTYSNTSSIESTKTSLSSASIISTSSSAVSLSASPKSSSISTSPITTSTSSSVKKSSSLSTPSSSAVSAVSTPSKPSSSAAVSLSKAAVSSVSKASVSSASKASVSAFSSAKSHYTSTMTTYLQSTITVYTTVYTTVGTGTTTKTMGGKTLTSTFLTTGTMTSTVTSTVKVTPTKGASGSASGSGSGVASGSSSATSSVVSPVTGSATASLSTSTGTSTLTVVKSSSTSTLTSLYTITVTAVPDVTITKWTTVHTTVCPATQTWSSGTHTWSSVYETTSLITETSSSVITLSTPTSAEVTVSEYTSVYTTVSPATATGVNGKSTFTRTYDVTSTVTTVVTSTATVTTVPFGTTTFSYTVPTSESTSSIKYPTGYHNSSKPHGTGSASKAHGTGSASKHASKFSSLLPISSGASASKGSSIPKPSSIVVTSKKASASASASGYVSKASSLPSKTSSSSSSTCSSAAPTKWAADCVPCEGQPGNDAFCGYTVNDNSYEVTPQTCGHKFYDFTITNQTIAPDGVARYGLVVNGQVPGPAVEANWGDWISVTVHNKMENNGSSIHFHGFRQYYTNEMDGVPSITQCPLAPGDSMTYTFRADNYGSSWYHSHFSLQTYEGVFGPVIIHGPASVTDYDEEQSIVLSDWSHIPVDQMYDAAQEVGPLPDHGPRTLDTGLINGMNVWGDDGSSSQVGERFVMNVKAGKKYRLRVVSAAIQATWKFYVDGHKFTVIANDFVPIKPYTTNILNINIGQRYDLIMEADQKVGNYWMRSDNQNACSTITGGKKIWGIVRYEGAPETLPTSTAYTYNDECVDEPMASLVPVVPLTVGAASTSIDENIFIGGNGGTPNLYKWTLSGTTFQSQWGDPTLYDIYNNGTVPTYSGSLAIEVPKLGEWVYIIIESVIPVPHPIHLHGHDFFVLAQGPGLYSAGSVALNLVNPPRRDVVLMSGHVVIAYQTDNPGVWLLHCHIGWHNAMGFAMQIIENLDGIKDTVTDSCQLEGTCAAWHAYAKKNNIVVIDSGV